MSLRFMAFMIVLLAVSPLKAAAADGTTPGAAASNEEGSANRRLLALAREPQRPRALSVLYGSYAALQVMDVVSTRNAIGAGAARESNPVMGSGETARLIALKATGTAASIYFAERMWKKNRVAAIVTMAAVNGITAAVVAHNVSIGR